MGLRVKRSEDLRTSGRLLNVLCMLNLHPVSTGSGVFRGYKMATLTRNELNSFNNNFTSKSSKLSKPNLLNQNLHGLVSLKSTKFCVTLRALAISAPTPTHPTHRHSSAPTQNNAPPNQSNVSLTPNYPYLPKLMPHTPPPLPHALWSTQNNLHSFKIMPH